MDEARKRWDSLAKPLGSLGLLEDVVVRIAALTGNADVHLNNRALLVLCADNGVVAQGVTQTDSLVTAAVARTLGAGESTVCHMARTADCRVVPVDIGVLDFPGTAGVLDRRVRNGTGDITQGPAMSRDECLRAIEVGMELVREQKAAGADILATGEMGIGNTTTSSAVASVLLGLDLAGLCGVFLGGAEYRIPVLVDGFISAVAALCAVRQKPEAGSAMLASHVSAEPAGRLVLDALGLKPLITAEMRLGEGSGAVAALPLLDMALAVYHSGHTFGKMGMEPYIPQN